MSLFPKKVQQQAMLLYRSAPLFSYAGLICCIEKCVEFGYACSPGMTVGISGQCWSASGYGHWGQHLLVYSKPPFRVQRDITDAPCSSLILDSLVHWPHPDFILCALQILSDLTQNTDLHNCQHLKNLCTSLPPCLSSGHCVCAVPL